MFVCQVMLPNCACIIYWARQISHLRGVLEANNEIDSQRLNGNEPTSRPLEPDY